jgi:hypothetical protein
VKHAVNNAEKKNTVAAVMYMCDTSHPNVETGSERLVIWGFAANICA